MQDLIELKLFPPDNCALAPSPHCYLSIEDAQKMPSGSLGNKMQTDDVSPFPNQRLNATKSSDLWPDFLAGQPGRPVRVLVVDDDRHMRNVIAQELLSDMRCDVVAQGGSLKEGRKLVTLHAFEVMLVDLNLGDGSGFELIEQLKAHHPLAEAVVISAMEDEQSAMKAFELGATGYLVKNSWFGNFPLAVLQVVNGGASITPTLARRLLYKLEHSQEAFGRAPVAHTVKDKLSEREKEVLKMVAAGYTSVEIGSRLLISHQTVNTHIKNVYRKLQVRSRAQAVSSAVHMGLI